MDAGCRENDSEAIASLGYTEGVKGYLLQSLLRPILAGIAVPILLNAQGVGSRQPALESGFSTSPVLFCTMAAINAAGYDAGLDSPLNERFQIRNQVRAELARRPIPSLPELKAFYKAHKKPNDTADLSQYISFALVAGGPPNFQLPDQVPPDVEALAGFSELLARFSKEANLEDLWNRSQQAYTSAIAEYQEPVIAALFEANGYLRNPSGYLGRRFEVFLDLLAAPNQLQVRSYKDDYFVVISPTPAPMVDEIRDAYLAYLLDPLSFKYSEAIKSKKALQKYAEDAPALDLAYKDDWSLLVTKCIIKAINARLSHAGAEKRQEMINQAMREGFILTAAIAELLPAYEKQQDAFRLYYPELINAIDVRKEEKRLKNVQFAQSVAPRVVAPPAKMQLDPADQALETADGLFQQRDLDNARKAYEKVLGLTNQPSKQGRAWYGLALINLEQKRWDEALNLFQKTVNAHPDPSSTAWAHYYLGQLAMKSGDHDKALAEFRMTLATEGASMKAKEYAEKAIQSQSGDKP